MQIICKFEIMFVQLNSLSSWNSFCCQIRNIVYQILLFGVVQNVPTATLRVWVSEGCIAAVASVCVRAHVQGRGVCVRVCVAVLDCVVLSERQIHTRAHLHESIFMDLLGFSRPVCVHAQVRQHSLSCVFASKFICKMYLLFFSGSTWTHLPSF